MQHKTNSSEYKTERIAYPADKGKLCILCKSKVKFAFPSDGKKVRTLDGIVYQIINFYRCTNPKCKFHTKAFLLFCHKFLLV